MDRDLSCVAGSIESPLLEITIGQALDSAAEYWGGRDAIVSAAQGIRWTWRDLACKADAMAADNPRQSAMGKIVRGAVQSDVGAVQKLALFRLTAAR